MFCIIPQELVEAVVICDRITGRSKGFGFVSGGRENGWAEGERREEMGRRIERE